MLSAFVRILHRVGFLEYIQLLGRNSHHLDSDFHCLRSQTLFHLLHHRSRQDLRLDKEMNNVSKVCISRLTIDNIVELFVIIVWVSRLYHFEFN